MASLISCVMIIPADQKAVGDQTSVALGYADAGAETYSAPLSPDGEEPATHWATHTWETAQYIANWNQTAAGHPPDKDWAAFGLTEQQVIDLANAQTMTTRADGKHTDHFEAAIAKLGLQRVRLPGPGQAQGVEP